MQVVNLFDVTASLGGPDSARAARAARNSYRLYQAVRFGAKVNPVVVWVDAGVAVLDAAAAFCRYRQAREITRALESDCRRLRRLLENELKTIGLQLDKLGQQEEVRQRTLEQQVAANCEGASHLQQKIVANRSLMESMVAHLDTMRRSQGVPARSFLELESAAHQLMRAHLDCLLNEIVT